MLLDDLLALLDVYAPERSALPNDPVGLLIEPIEREITGVTVCLDATSHVAEIARQRRSQLIIAHHPLIYRPLPQLVSSDPIASIALNLARSGTGLYAMHTNWDAAKGGINDTLTDAFGLIDTRPLGSQMEAALARIGRLPAPISAADLLDLIRSSLPQYPTSALRYPRELGDQWQQIEIVAVCGGAGSSLAALAQRQEAQAFVTADVRHHEFIDAAARGILLIDAGHEATEVPGMIALAERLQRDLPALNVSFAQNWP